MTDDLGILLVHGIGDQPRGATLVDFGTPLVEWLQERGAVVEGDVHVLRAVLAPGDDEPAHAELRVGAGGVTRRWLLAEAWWAEAFRLPRFADLARWGLGVVPRTFGMHFGLRLWRAWRAPAGSGWRRVAWMGRVASAFVSLLGGIALSLAMLVGLSALLVLGLIPWERLRAGIARLQLRMASSIGDSYILVSRPIESAAILTRFADDLRWLEQRCSRVAIVAHSQGGAVACRALESISASATRLLVTFGSGLRKLEELEDLRRRPGFRRGAGLTVVGLALVGFCLATLPGVVAHYRQDIDSFGSLGIVLVYLGVGLTLLAAGIGDFVAGYEPGRLRQQGRALGERLAGWMDVFASADPVPNGRLHEDEAAPPASVPVVNHGSMLSDHTSYWRNRDEFVTVVVDRLLAFDGGLPALRLDPAAIRFLSERRAARVRLLRASWWVALAAAAALTVRYWVDWLTVLAWLGPRSMRWASSVVGVTSGAALGPAPSAAAWRHSLGCLALALAGYAAARTVWSGWNRHEMAAMLSVRRLEDWHTRFAVAVWFQIAACGIAFTGTFSGWWVMAGFVAVVPFMWMSGPSLPPGLTAPASDASEKTPPGDSYADSMARLLKNLFNGAVMIIGFPWALWSFVSTTKDLLGRWVPAWQAGWLIATGVVLAAGLLLSFTLVALAQAAIWWRGRAARSGKLDGG